MSKFFYLIKHLQLLSKFIFLSEINFSGARIALSPPTAGVYLTKTQNCGEMNCHGQFCNWSLSVRLHGGRKREWVSLGAVRGWGGGSDGDFESERDTAAPQGHVSCDRERWPLASLLPPPSFSSIITFEIPYFSWRRSKEKYQRRPLPRYWMMHGSRYHIRLRDGHSREKLNLN